MFLVISRAQLTWEEAVDRFLSSKTGQAMTHDFDAEMLKTLRSVLTALILPPHDAPAVTCRAIANHAGGSFKPVSKEVLSKRSGSAARKRSACGSVPQIQASSVRRSSRCSRRHGRDRHKSTSWKSRRSASKAVHDRLPRFRSMVERFFIGSAGIPRGLPCPPERAHA